MARDLVFTILGIDRGSPAFDKVSAAADKASQRLDNYGKVGLKTLAAVPAAALAGGVAASGAMGLLVAGIVGVAGAVLASNERVNHSFSQLGIGVAQSVRDAAAPMEDEFVLAADQMRQAADDARPEILRMFSAAQPAVDDLTRGVVGLATNALPGMTRAVERSEPAVAGFSSMLADTGQGVSDFFTNLSEGSESSGQVMESTGRIVRDFAGFSGSLFALLSNSGSPAVATLERFLRQLEGTVLSLGADAFPALATSASGFLSAGTGLLRLLQLISPLVGPLASEALTLAAALKLVNMVTFGGVSAGLGVVKTAMGEADGAGNKFKAGLGALATGPLPILGVAAAALSFILQDLGKKEREAAEAAAYHDKVVRGLIGTLDAQSGAITDETRRKIANQVATENVNKANTTLASQAGRLKIAQDSVVSAITNTDGGLRRMDSSLRATVTSQIRATLSAEQLQQIQFHTGKTVDDLATIYMGGAGGVEAFQNALQDADSAVEGSNGMYEKLGLQMQSATLDSRNLWGGISELNLGLTDAQKQALLAAEGIGKMTPAQLEAKAKADALKTSYATLGDAFKTSAEKGQALLDVLDRMSGKSPDLREAEQAWNDLMRSVNKQTDWDSTAEGIQKLGKTLVDMRGEVDTTTEAGSKLQDWARQSSVDFANTATAMRAAGVPADEMSRKLGIMRQQFIDNAVAQGLPEAAAKRLADAYHLVPDLVSTLVLTPNLAQKMQEMGLFATQVRTLPNGYVSVTANTDTARNVVTKFIQDTDGKVITIRISGVVDKNIDNRIYNTGSGRPFMAAGGWVTGPGNATSDSIPTMLSDGEFVVNAAAAQRNRGILEAINAGTRPIGLAGGGMVGSSPAAGAIHKHYHLTVVTRDKASVVAEFRRMEILAGV